MQFSSSKKLLTDGSWINKNNYYYKRLASFYKFIIPQDSIVLQVVCRSGYLLNSVKPSFGLGIDSSSEYIKEAREKYSHLNFICGNANDLKKDEKFSKIKFDYIILSHTLMLEDDIQILLEDLKQFCTSRTRLIINICSSLWEPFLRLGQILSLRRDIPFKNWLQMADLENLLNLASYEVVYKDYRTLMPKYVPLVSEIFNYGIANVPFINRGCLDFFVVARPEFMVEDVKSLTCSVIVTCKNEKGNIRNAIVRIPKMGSKTEIIFVEGGSKDGTLEEIKTLAEESKDDSFFDIKYFVQNGKGKADAVRLGFSKAQGDILMIKLFRTIGYKGIERHYISDYKKMIQSSLMDNKFELVKFTKMPSFLPKFVGLYFGMLFRKI